jgi:phosphoribosylglycinamide formyltransferase-1
MKKIVVLISGSGSNLQAIIDRCKSKYIQAEIVCVISNNPTAFGLERARSAGIKTFVINHKEYQSRDLFDSALYKILKDQNADLIVLAGFMRILGNKITKKFDNKMINLHPSILPLYPGLNTHEKVLQNNDKNHGITIHYVSSELDAGPIIAQGLIEVKTNESKDHLIERIHKIEHILFPEIINEICKGNIGLKDNKVIFKNLNDANGGLIKRFYEL